MVITYRTGNDLGIDAVIELYRASTLGERRPIDDPGRIAAMLKNADLVVTAWDGDQPVGIARALTDHVYRTYLSDLAVRVSHQRQGIGKALIERVRKAAPDALLTLLSAPKAVDHYPHIGLADIPWRGSWDERTHSAESLLGRAGCLGATGGFSGPNGAARLPDGRDEATGSTATEGPPARLAAPAPSPRLAGRRSTPMVHP